jgi:hypothetical protein
MTSVANPDRLEAIRLNKKRGTHPMPITDAKFDNEQELQDWVYDNIKEFFGECLLLPGFRITTPSGKHGIPDGFAFNFSQRAWWIIECELLSHGVWPHIAEQITRYVVAGRNAPTLRQVRDKVFQGILATDSQEQVADELHTDVPRLLQQLELFLEGVAPTLAVFINDTNQDLNDFCDALDVPTEIYRIKKLIVNELPEYYSPDHNAPAVVTTPEQTRSTGSAVFDVVEQLGGGELINSRLKCYRLNDGREIKVQYSKFYDRHQAYWYGVSPSAYGQAKDAGCTDYVFIMGQDGFAVIPFVTVDEYLETAYVTNTTDGKVRHHHIHLSPPPDVVMKGYGNTKDIDASELFRELSD